MASVFPEIDFTLPGTAVGNTVHGVVTEDEWGRYALLTGVLPDDVSLPPHEQAASAFAALERELGEIGMDFYWAKNVSKSAQEKVFRYILEHCHNHKKFCFYSFPDRCRLL